jgi:hypothetical protein
MATDPVRNIQSETFETPLDIHTTDPLRHLASLPANLDIPYLTITLDWTPGFDDPGRQPTEERRQSEQRNRPAEDPTSRRPARTWLDKELKALANTLEPRSDQLAQLESSIAQVSAWLDSLDPSASGTCIVAGPDLFIPLALGVPIPNAVTYRPLPALDALAHVAEDYATYAVLVADQENAELSFITQGVRDQAVSLTSTLYPRRQRQGGLNERRYKARADERVSHFARAIASEIQTAFREEPVEVLILAGSRVLFDELHNHVSADISDRIAGMVPMDLKPWPSIQAVIDATRELDVAAEREREANAAAQVRELLGQNQAVAGPVDVLNALQSHQVHQLVINEDFQETGWADLTLPLYGLGEVPAEHPTGGDAANLIEVQLAEEFVRLALRSDGQLEMVHVSVPIGATDSASRSNGDRPRTEAATQLDEVGGVGAILRYTT